MLEHWTPYRPELAKEYEEKGYWKKENFSQVFDNIAERFWEREALVGGDQRYTYGELKKGTDRLALHFVKMGLKHQDRVVVQLINIPEFVFIYIALQKIGVIPVMCLPQHRYTEISQIAAKAEAVGYIIPGFAKKYNYVELVEQVAADLPSMKLKMIAGVNQEVPEGYYYINELLNTPIEGEDDAELLRSYLPDPHDVCIILLSGGTTGIPKLIAREYNAYRYVAEESSRELGYNMYTVQLAVAPVAHNMVLAAPRNPGRVLVRRQGRNVDLPEDRGYLQAHRKRAHHARPDGPRYDYQHAELRRPSEVRPLLLGDRHQTAVRRSSRSSRPRVYPELGCRLISQFGMSEGTITQTSLFDSEEVTYNTIGLPVSPADEWKIVDKDDGHVIAESVHDGTARWKGEAEKPGEIIFRGPYTIRGYYNAPDHNKKAFTEDGYYRSGDLAAMHESGKGFVIMGRIKGRHQPRRREVQLRRGREPRPQEREGPRRGARPDARSGARREGLPLRLPQRPRTRRSRSKR
ncbi:AMP-binding protein [uncultured Cloacibacillus sp.]|uniref:AMP-binding protein n=1 Tax=uncultured Cloacibacillus sp. TaxID=889794 RepID=UPI003208F4ED